MGARHARTILLLVVASGCVVSGCAAHHGAEPDDDDTGSSDGGVPSTPVDAGCTAQLDVPTQCHVRWARAIGADSDLVGIDDLVMGEDGSPFALMRVASESHVQIDGGSFGGGGYRVLLAFAPDGTFRWAQEGLVEFPLAVSEEELLMVRFGSPGFILDHRDPMGGGLRHQEPLPDGVLLRTIALGACENGCALRELRVFTWSDHVDLGELGALDEPHGLTLLMLEDGTPRWHWSAPMDEGFGITAVVPSSGVASDGSVTVSFGILHDPPDHSVCLGAAGCFPRSGSVLLRFDPDGELVRARTFVDRIWSIALTADGGAIVGAAGAGPERVDASFDTVWQNEDLGGYVSRLVVDRTTGLVRAAVGVPSTPLDLLGTTVVDCIEAYPWSASSSVFVALDDETGRLVSTHGAFRGRARRALPHPEGGMLVAIAAEGSTTSELEICGETFRPESRGSVLAAVIAHIE
ncbi:MAG: hypothetical protein AB7S26_05300 [Sandaracinaceae bacterium]